MGTLAIGLTRAGVGLSMLARPELMPTLLGVDRISARRSGWIVRMVGIREVVLGAGAAQAVLSKGTVRPWLLAGALSDLGDTAALGLAVRGRHVSVVRGAVVAITAVGAFVAGISAVRDADKAQPET